MEPLQPSDGEKAGGQAPAPAANPGYTLGQIAAALRTSRENDDPATRERAGRKAASWVRVLQGMLSGSLKIGSRVPVSDTPAWATLQVMQGGFATGGLLAGGEIKPHEAELLAKLGIDPDSMPEGIGARAALNSYYLTEAGLADLQEMLESGRYRIEVPEEGALPVVLWLMTHGRVEAARGVLQEIGPFMDRLRFYPVPHERRLASSEKAYLDTVGDVIANLERVTTPRQALAQRESALVWNPLYDGVVALFLETVEGDAPSLRVGEDGKIARGDAGRAIVEGGWPCRRYPDGWQVRARRLLERCSAAKAEHAVCRKPERRGENFFLLRRFLATCAEDPERLTGRDVGMIRSILARIVAKRGTPDSTDCQNLRRLQSSIAELPTRPDFARVAIGRLEGLPQDEGAEAMLGLLGPVSELESESGRPQAGRTIPLWLREKVMRCQSASPEELINLGIITSGETLARVLPQTTAQASAAGIADPDLRRCYIAVYQAFRRRRSLLLLNLQSQVKLSELPWVQAIHSSTGGADKHDGKGAALKAFEETAWLAVSKFPHQILPNKLLQELRALASGAGLALPLVEEVAADIFMGEFSVKFLRAAKIAGGLLGGGSLYERYYDAPYAAVMRMAEEPARDGAAPVATAFSQLCTERAKLPETGSSRAARNGAVIEQEQILTTHNLAAMFSEAHLAARLRPLLPGLARDCFGWICRRLRRRSGLWRAELQSVKNAAYAWRQMVFFLALLPGSEVQEFLVWADEHLGHEPPEFRARFMPALEGLKRGANGLPVEAESSGAAGRLIPSRRFLGWATQGHWLLPKVRGSAD